MEGTLDAREAELLRQEVPALSPIVFWEVAKLIRLGRVSGIAVDDPALSRIYRDAHILPMTLEVVRVSDQLQINGDPVDELIAATSVVYEIPLLTRDREIRASGKVTLAA